MAQPLQGGDDAFAWPKMHAAPAPDPFQAYPQDVPLSDEELLMLEAQRSPLPLLPSDCRVSGEENSILQSIGMEGMFGAISPVRGIGPFLSAEERDALMFLLQTDVEENDDGSSSADGLAAAYPSSSSAVSYGCRPAFNQSANDASGSETPQSVDQPIVTLAPKKRRRRRQKEELDFLRVHVVALETQIARLRQKEMDRAYGAAQTGGQLLFMAPMNPPGMWERVANDQLARARAAMLENMHLRAQYEAQLHLVKRLEAMAHNSSCYPVRRRLKSLFFVFYWRHDLRFTFIHNYYNAVIVYHLVDFAQIPALSISSMQDDSAVFALLGHDLDAQYTQVDRILSETGLAGFDGLIINDVRPKRGANGRFCIENIHSNLLPFSVEAIDHAFWYYLSTEGLQMQHELYKVIEAKSDTALTKIIHTIQISETEHTTITVRTALKRYIEAHRAVTVSDAMIEAVGAVSLRLRERSWVQVRPSHVRHLNETGPMSAIQICNRIVPEQQGSFFEHDLAVGTPTSLLTRLYHQHKLIGRHVVDDLLIKQFKNISI